MLETKPDKVTLSQWQETNGSLFEHLNVPGTDADIMDFLLASMYGERKVRIFFENKSAQEVGELIDKVYGQRWQAGYNAFQELLALEGDSVVTSENESLVDISRSTDTNQINKTSGFDGVELVDDNGADISGTDDTTNTASGSNKGVTKTQAGLLEKERLARENKFQESVCHDIARFITLSIY